MCYELIIRGFQSSLGDHWDIIGVSLGIVGVHWVYHWVSPGFIGAKRRTVQEHSSYSPFSLTLILKILTSCPIHSNSSLRYDKHTSLFRPRYACDIYVIKRKAGVRNN